MGATWWQKKHMVCNYDKFTIVMDVSPIYIYYMFIVWCAMLPCYN
jgi:hypothetical protein